MGRICRCQVLIKKWLICNNKKGVPVLVRPFFAKHAAGWRHEDQSGFLIPIHQLYCILLDGEPFRDENWLDDSWRQQPGWTAARCRSIFPMTCMPAEVLVDGGC